MCGPLTPLGLAYNCKKLDEYFIEFFVTYLACVITKINKSQKISTCYVKYVSFISEKKSRKGRLTSLALLGLS